MQKCSYVLLILNLLLVNVSFSQDYESMPRYGDNKPYYETHPSEQYDVALAPAAAAVLAILVNAGLRKSMTKMVIRNMSKKSARKAADNLKNNKAKNILNKCKSVRGLGKDRVLFWSATNEVLLATTSHDEYVREYLKNCN